MRFILLAAAAVSLPAFAQANFNPGDHVLGSPMSMNSIWKRCVIKSGPDATGYYQADCADEYVGINGKTQTVHTFNISGRWLKPDDASFRPDLQVDKARAAETRAALGRAAKQAAAAKAAAAADLAAKNAPPPKALAAGAYECWAYSSPRLLLNFKVTGDGQYQGSDNSSGRFRFDAAGRQVTFLSGTLAGAMPAGFKAIYELRRGKPTLSYQSPSGNEAAFCEHV